MLVYLSKTRLPPVALMPFWFLPHPFNPDHLALLRCNRCSTLYHIGNCAELRSLKLVRGRNTW